METINANAAILSNYEVLSLLQDTRSKQKRSAKSQVAAVQFEAMRYLQNSPCAEQTPEKIKQLLSAYESFNLTKAEKLMLINDPPQKEVDVHLMVEESAERLTDDQIQEILTIAGNQPPEEEIK
ncbi:hypothetical protein R5R35_012642 [Gryllus longicercus]|uniref:DNA-directed RNA polymerase III subunit RPC9 n=1 Tax=Gryllus longicercus TaxID=2509291 RepID=A0AAN9VF70_9ORTH